MAVGVYDAVVVEDVVCCYEVFEGGGGGGSHGRLRLVCRWFGVCGGVEWRLFGRGVWKQRATMYDVVGN